ncbi:tyrosine-type recombinase/integrase [Streptomyces sp. NPDC018693]|uniref:tyrosine-type recombinase/integrase n=1 Tax=unclassified Streptomyces TaxID=2593676 RepID=UPI003796DC47
MAYVKPMKNKDGVVTSYRVRWRKGGARNGRGESERFDGDEAGLEAAELFCEAVNQAGQDWPPGWVKGKGMIAPDAADDSEYRFERYAAESVNHRTGVEDRYRDACHGELARYINPTFGNCDIRSSEHFSKRTIQAWVNQLELTKVRRGSKTKLMSPKTIKNLHGLLSSIMQEAVEADPPLRDRNPCKGVRLPRVDDDGTADDEIDEDIEFLEPAEVAGVASCMRTVQGRRLVEDIYATGERWGEISAQACRHLDRTDPGKPRVKVVRAWKWSKSKGHYLGKPKSKRSRRSVRITLHTYDNWVAQGALTRGPDELIYHNGQGGRLPYSTFYDEWMAAVQKAKELGLLPAHKNPTIHDLRHSHAAALISAGHSLTYVQRRLGHESIKTTSDLYGHLLPEADDAAMSTIDASLDGSPITHVSLPEPATVPAARKAAAVSAADGSVVHVVVFPDGHQEAFWRDDFARLVADVWKLERRQEARVEQRSASLWEARHGTLDGVHPAMPGRVKVWALGPAVYGPDGEQQATTPDAHELREVWIWEWEDGYTTSPARYEAQHRSGPAAQTEARAWGTDKKQVRSAYVKARARALQICPNHPAVVRARVGQTES